MQMPLPLTRDLVLVGGGHAHALVARMWGMRPLAGARLTLINPGPTATYSGMLPGFVAGHYDRDDLEIDLVRLARFAGARFVKGTVTGLDRSAGTVVLTGGREIRYDVVSIDVGIHTRMPEIAGFETFGIAAKPLDSFADAWSRWCEALARGEVLPECCVIGGGLAGVELALAMRHCTTQMGKPARICVVESDVALGAVAGRTRRVLLQRLRQAEVTLHERCIAAEITGEGVRLEDGRFLRSSFTLGVAGARAHDWLGGLGLETHEGHISVDPYLRSVTDPAIFASGDCAHMGFAPRPKAGVFAVRAAPVLFHNLRAALSGGAHRRFWPQSDYLKLVSLGDRAAVADKRGITLSGRLLWRWKDRIDRRFMEKLTRLPKMRGQDLPRDRATGVEKVAGDQPLCGGCGAKVAGAGLSSALQRLPAPVRSDVLSLPGDDAAVLDVGGARQVLTTDHLRAFTSDPSTFARIAAVHALGDIWAMAARPQAALANVTLTPMSEDMQVATLSEILDAAVEVFRAEGADLVGGHTSIGAELSVGFTLTGLVERRPIMLSGAQSGDALILTKPIGSGTVLAAEMQGRARGSDVLATLDAMARPQGEAARILSSAHAMTDVTGFGLAGHLLAICDASGVSAEIVLDAIPLHAGAERLAAEGIRSTLFPANRVVSARMVLPDSPRAALLFDPQTAGGLLAAVDAARVPDLLEALRNAGFDAQEIGRIVAGPPFVTVR